MDIFTMVMLAIQVLLAASCAFNVVPTNTEENLLDRFVVTLLWTSLALESGSKLLGG